MKLNEHKRVTVTVRASTEEDIATALRIVADAVLNGEKKASGVFGTRDRPTSWAYTSHDDKPESW